MQSDIVQAHPYLFLGSRLKRLAEQMQTDVLRVSERIGLAVQPGQFPILATLEDGRPTTITALAKLMHASQPAVTQAIGKLEKAGLVAIAQSRSDRRRRDIRLTVEGKHLLDRARREVWPHVDAAVRETVDGLGGDFLGELSALEVQLSRQPLSARAEEIARRELVPVAATQLPQMAALINRAYRGIGDRSGWTSEEAYMVGNRTKGAKGLAAEVAASPGAMLLAWRQRDKGAIDGCVCLGPIAGEIWSLGTLVVEPSLQNAGLGRRLLASAESWMGERGARVAEISVVNVRETLLAWYARRGYTPTGETRPWPADDRFGTPTRDDLEFVVLRKMLAA